MTNPPRSAPRIFPCPGLTMPARPVTVCLQRIPLDSGGYDDNGAYWGLGQRLYWACTEDGALETFFRAPNRAAAREAVRKEWARPGVGYVFTR